MQRACAEPLNAGAPMRPAGTRGEGKIAPLNAAITAHTTLIHPTCTQTCGAYETTEERTVEPGKRGEIAKDKSLHNAIRTCLDRNPAVRGASSEAKLRTAFTIR